MTKNTSTNNKKGFSLVELCIALAILSILTASIVPVFIKRIQIKAAEKTALEMSVIQQAALSYFAANNAWPASLSALQSAGYLNPSWVTNNPWQNPYVISSTSDNFTVTTSVPQEWTNLVARDLPTSSVSINTVSSIVPALGSAPDESLPAGSIIIWSGTIASIPEGWQLCNGANGSPDLRDRFVVGARQDSGGTAKTSVSGGLTKTGGEAYHTLSTAEMPVHTHSVTSHFSYGVRPGDDNVGAMTSGQTGAAGGGQPHNNLPPYYALCFIMKMQ